MHKHPWYAQALVGASYPSFKVALGGSPRAGSITQKRVAVRIMPGGGCSFIHPHLLDASSPIPYSSPIPFRLASVCSATIASHRTTCGTAPQHPSPVHPRDAFMRLLTAGTKYVHESNHVRDAFVFENRDRRCASKGRCPRLFYLRACRPWTQSTTLLTIACWLFCQCISACRRRQCGGAVETHRKLDIYLRPICCQPVRDSDHTMHASTHPRRVWRVATLMSIHVYSRKEFST